ncbi:phytoene/squalene synthase family protein [candidate division WOR-3 bacterium]|nr:phytoene/squalene synthase family protein [candidate division WOR-3 bacterium]
MTKTTDVNLKGIFQSGSKTFYNSSLFFPNDVLEDVVRLYAFVRTIDDFVDFSPAKKEEYMIFKEDYRRHISGRKTDNEIIRSFVELKNQKKFSDSWIDSFFESMEMDLEGRSYETIEDTNRYVYGSAEVIGLFMCKIFSLPPSSYKSAMMFGKALQYINFVRDVKEDIALKRIYFPNEDFSRYGILREDFLHCRFKNKPFSRFMRFQVRRCLDWLCQGEKGLVEIPRRLRLPVKTASDMYKWTLKKIWNDPTIVLEKKIRPSRHFVFYKAMSNIFNSTF